MTERRLKRSVIYAVYALGIISLIGTIYLIEGATSNNSFKEDEEYEYVSKTIFDTTVPVVSEVKELTRPHKDADITILRSYYDYKADAASQEKSLIYYEGTYLQSSGVSYGRNDIFEVVSIKDGTVTEVKEDELLGNIVQIKHNDDTVSIYQSLSEVIVEKDEIVTRGQTIAKSGTSNVEKDLGNHVHFELIVSGNTVNPEEYFSKNIQS